MMTDTELDNDFIQKLVGQNEHENAEKTTRFKEKFRALNAVCMKRGTPKQCFSHLSVDGTIVDYDGVILATRDLYVGQTLCFFAPLGRILMGEIVRDVRFDKIYVNSKTGMRIAQNPVLDVHFSTKIRMSTDILECNCAILDDTRVVCLMDTYKLGYFSHLKQKYTELTVYPGNWECSSELQPQ